MAIPQPVREMRFDLDSSVDNTLGEKSAKKGKAAKGDGAKKSSKR